MTPAGPRAVSARLKNWATSRVQACPLGQLDALARTAAKAALRRPPVKDAEAWSLTGWHLLNRRNRFAGSHAALLGPLQKLTNTPRNRPLHELLGGHPGRGHDRARAGAAGLPGAAARAVGDRPTRGAPLSRLSPAAQLVAVCAG